MGTMPYKLFLHVKENWSVLKRAPGVFVGVFVFAVVTAFGGLNFFYQARIDGLLSRVEAKDEQIAEYREKLELASTNNTAWSRLPDEKLKAMAMDLANEMRAFLMENMHLEDDWWSLPGDRRSRMTGTNPLILKYNKIYSTRTIILRDELISRLPKVVRRSRPSRWSYAYVLTSRGIEKVIEDIETMAELLP